MSDLLASSASLGMAADEDQTAHARAAHSLARAPLAAHSAARASAPPRSAVVRARTSLHDVQHAQLRAQLQQEVVELVEGAEQDDHNPQDAAGPAGKVLVGRALAEWPGAQCKWLYPTKAPLFGQFDELATLKSGAEREREHSSKQQSQHAAGAGARRRRDERRAAQGKYKGAIVLPYGLAPPPPNPPPPYPVPRPPPYPPPFLPSFAPPAPPRTARPPPPSKPGPRPPIPTHISSTYRTALATLPYPPGWAPLPSTSSQRATAMPPHTHPPK